ncbi:TetR/AcrR family transcriptional regulator [Peribacillus sp. SI8-4]|uniref:TetR/AcrR family transcriptional regulator n=1 Tax=Peribacillus sp. SI8-4 TaxID=3048009 RepID=UPI002553604F|nr:TetR/AcrR family transcriptional regulator [Peribacillus sp. SI8-4]
MKEKMTEHSIRLFEKKGFSATSITDIVESIGVTKGTFYYYFTSKEQLLMDIHLAYIDELLNEQAKIISTPGKTCKDILFDIVLMLLKSIKTKKSSATVFFREMKNLSDEKLAQILPKRDEFRSKIEQVLISGIASGEMRGNLDASIISFAILGVANWSYHWFDPEGEKNEQEVADIFMGMILHGIEA